MQHRLTATNRPSPDREGEAQTSMKGGLLGTDTRTENRHKSQTRKQKQDIDEDTDRGKGGRRLITRTEFYTT